MVWRGVVSVVCSAAGLSEWSVNWTYLSWPHVHMIFWEGCNQTPKHGVELTLTRCWRCFAGYCAVWTWCADTQRQADYGRSNKVINGSGLDATLLPKWISSSVHRDRFAGCSFCVRAVVRVYPVLCARNARGK